MIELIDGLKDEVIGFHGHGKITKDDYQQILIPEVEGHLKRHENVRILCHLGPDFQGYEAAAAWEDTKLGLGHLRHWERIAIVTDNGAIVGATKAVGFLMRGVIKVFANDQMEQAKLWIQES